MGKAIFVTIGLGLVAKASKVITDMYKITII